MSSPALEIPDNVKAARLQVQTSDFFALCYLMLCQLSYAAEDNGPEAVKQIRTQLPKMPVPTQGPVQGQWRLAWGPQIPNDGSNSNLMYAAEFIDSVSKVPVFSAVVIRGTDTQARPSGIVKQIIEDLAADKQISFPAGNTTGSKIALGSSIGLTTLTNFKDPDTGQLIETYLQGFVTENPDAPIVVTGHSLGGCQTTVMATYLSTKLPPETKFVPNSFAAPTAGNSDFIQLYQTSFPFSPRWYNNIDLVPNAFASLAKIRGLWSMCSRPAPFLVKVAVEGLKLVLEIANASYAQQSDGDSRSLQGQCQLPTAGAVSTPVQTQAVQEIKTILESLVAKLAAQGRLPEIMKRLAGDIPFTNALGGLAAHLAPPQNVVNLIFQHFSLTEFTAWVQELLFQHLILTGYWNAVEGSNGVAPIPNPFPLKVAAAA